MAPVAAAAALVAATLPTTVNNGKIPHLCPRRRPRRVVVRRFLPLFPRAIVG